MTLRLVPVTLREANAFVERHHRPARGCLFCLGVEDGEVRGVAIVGRPVARELQDGYTAEVVRVCTDGARNACSMLYAAAWRAACAIGYHRLLTYTLPEEGGASLRAAGWKLIGAAGSGSWNVPSRPRVDLHPTQQKLRWEAPSPKAGTAAGFQKQQPPLVGAGADNREGPSAPSSTETRSTLSVDSGESRGAAS